MQLPEKICEKCNESIPFNDYYLRHPKAWRERRMCSRKCSRFIHGGKKDYPILYKKWKNMRNRCNNPNNHAYKHYGARGIKVCERWNSFQNFLDDMGETFRPNLSLERIDNDGNYEPSNCKWASITEQQNNKRNTRRITANGVTKSVAEWSRMRNIKFTTLYRRIYDLKWPIYKALELERNAL